jgi:hypothetical protein
MNDLQTSAQGVASVTDGNRTDEAPVPSAPHVESEINRVRRLLAELGQAVNDLAAGRRQDLRERRRIIEEFHHAIAAADTRAPIHTTICAGSDLPHIEEGSEYLSPHLEWMRKHAGAWQTAKTEAGMAKVVQIARAVSRQTANRLIAMALKAHG